MEKAIKKRWPIFVLPTLIAFIIGFIWPFIQGLYLSFCQFITIDNANWRGFDNYMYVFQDEAFLDSFVFTVKFAIVSVGSINILAFALAGMVEWIFHFANPMGFSIFIVIIPLLFRRYNGEKNEK